MAEAILRCNTNRVKVSFITVTQSWDYFYLLLLCKSGQFTVTRYLKEVVSNF